MRTEILKREHCFLSPLAEEDLSLIKNWRNEQIEVLRQNKILTDEDQKNWFEKVKTDKNQVLFAILSGDELLGYCGITHLDFSNHRGEVSFIMNTEIAKNEPEYEKYFLEVLDMLKAYAFEELKLHKLFTETYEFRKFHIGVLEKFGFNFDGRYKEHVFHEGKYVDSLIHSLIHART